MYQLRPYQQDAVDAAWQFLCSQAGNPVICMATGAGKSLIIAQACKDAIERYNGRVIVLAHRKELLQQNAEKIRALLPDMDIGVYSAGLKSRDTDHAIVVAGIQSAYKRAFDFGQRHLVIVDEVHLVPSDGEGIYRTFLSDLRTANPGGRMIGLTATPFRLDCGPICAPQSLFQKVCYSAPIRELIDAGWLCNLTTKPANATVDTSGLHVRGGEFIEHEVIQAFDQRSIVEASCREIVANTTDRKSVLIFCAGVSHAMHVKQTIETLTQEPCGIVTGETLPLERSETLTAFKERRLRFLCNIDVLTTGFDAPCIDAICLLRATLSPGLYCQMIGRGFRVYPSKSDTKVLDFGGNIRRHGPIDAIDFGRPKGHGGHAGEAPVKVCPNCETEIHLSARDCECGFVFPPPKPAHDETADDAPILSEPVIWNVEEIRYSRHTKTKGDGPPTMRVDYVCRSTEGEGNLDEKRISEWVCLEHDGYARMKAMRWWRARSIAPIPTTVDEAVGLCQCGAVASARRITTRQDGRWLRVVSAELDEKPSEWSAEPAAVGWESDEENLPF